MATTYYPTGIKYLGTTYTYAQVGREAVLSPTVTLTVKQFCTEYNRTQYRVDYHVYYQATLSSALKYQISVALKIVGGEDSDYTSISTAVGIPAGSTSGTTSTYNLSDGLNIYKYNVTCSITNTKIGNGGNLVVASTSSVTSNTINNFNNNVVIAKANIYLNKIKYVR